MDYKVSVIVPVYNAHDYLHECMDSLVHQSLKEIEIIAINDGSTDDSLEILRKYESEYDNVFVYDQEDLGQANAMNRGLMLAHGEYVAECDSDDYVSLITYERLYEIADGKADAVKCNFFGVYPNGQLNPTPLTIPKEYELVPINTKELKGQAQAVVLGRMCSIWAGMYKRSFIIDNKLFYREHHNYEDTCLEFKIRALAKDYRITKEHLYYYRRENPNSGTSTIKDDFAICEQFDEIKKFNNSNNLPFMEYMNAYRYYEYMWNLSRVDDSRKAVFLKKAEKDFKENPTRQEYFNNEKDWKNYCLIESGLWRKVGLI